MTKKEKFFKNETTGFGVTSINYAGYGYGSHYAGMINIYGFAPDGSIFDYIVKYHRSKVIINHLIKGEWWNIHEDIRNNYATNGYSTRIGLKRSIHKLNRISKIAESHRLITNKGKNAHNIRVALRN